MKKSIIIIGVLCLVCISGLFLFVNHANATIAFQEALEKNILIKISDWNYPYNISQEIYNTDLSTHLALTTRTVTANETINSYSQHSRQMRLADWQSFNKSQFTIYVSAFTFTSAVIRVNVTLDDGTKTNRTVNITAVGEYTILSSDERVVASNASNVSQIVSAAAGTMTYTINQSRYGNVGRMDKQYTFYNSSIYVFQANITQDNEQWIFICTHANFSSSNNVMNTSGLNSSMSFSNMSISAYMRTGWTIGYFILMSPTTLGAPQGLFLSNCYLFSNRSAYITGSQATTQIRINNSIFQGVGIVTASYYINGLSIKGQSSTLYAFSGVTFAVVPVSFTVANNYQVMFISGVTFGIQNVVFKENTYTAAMSSFTAFVNMSDCTFDTTSIVFVSRTTGVLARNYTFTLRVINNSGPVKSTVIIRNRDLNVEVYNQTTPTTGITNITWLNYSYWISATPVYCYNYSINITSFDNPQNTIQYNFSTGVPINCTAFLDDKLNTSLTVYENLLNVTGTNQSAYSSLTGWNVWNNYTGTQKLGKIEVTSYKATNDTFNTTSTTLVNVSGLNLSIEDEPENSRYFFMWSFSTNASSSAYANFSIVKDNVTMVNASRLIGNGVKEVLVQATFVHSNISHASHWVQCRVNISDGRVFIYNSTFLVWNTWDNDSFLPSNSTILTSEISTTVTSYENMTGTRFNITLNYPSRVFIMRTCEARISNAAKKMYATVKVDNETLDDVYDEFEGTDWKVRSAFYLTDTLSAGRHEIIGAWHTDAGTTAYARDIYISAISPVDLNNNIFSGGYDYLSSNSTTASTLVDMGVSTHITLTQRGHIFAFLSMAMTFTDANKNGYFVININGTDYGTKVHSKAVPNQRACVAYATRSNETLIFEPGIYVVKAKWRTDAGQTLSGNNISLFAFSSRAGTCPTCGSSDLTIYDNFANCTGTNETSYSTTTGWKVWNNVTGYNGLLILENLLNAAGTNQTSWNGTRWIVWNNYTGTGGGESTFFHVDNSNPANGSVVINSASGQSTCADLTYDNFTVLSDSDLGTGTLMEYFNAGDDNIGQPLYGAEFASVQGIHIGTTGPDTDFVLTKIRLLLNGVGAGATATVTLRTSPYMGPVISTGTVAVPLGGPTWFDISMTPVLLNMSTDYYILVQALDGDAANYIVWRIKNGGGYLGGAYEEGSNIGGMFESWILTIDSALFEVYGWTLGGNITWDHIVNLSWSDNTSGSWTIYGTEHALNNDTYCMFDSNLKGTGKTYYWNLSANNSIDGYVNKSYWFSTSSNSTSLVVNENNFNVSGGYTSVYNVLSGWVVNNSYTGNNSLFILENLIHATGTNQTSWNGTSWTVWNNYTGTDDGSILFLMDNPNPANGTCFGYNFLQMNPLGIKTCIDITYKYFNETYVYAVGEVTDKVYQYWRSNMTKKNETDSYGDRIWAVSEDDLYLYVGGDIHKIFQYYKSNMTKKTETIDFGDNIKTIVNDGEYVYCAGMDKKVFQCWKSNLSVKSETVTTGSSIYVIAQDDTYIYVAKSGFPSRVYQYWKTNMTKTTLETDGYGGAGGGVIKALVVDDDYVYAGGDTQQTLCQYWKVDFTLKEETDSFLQDVYSVVVDDNYVYVGGGFQKIWQFWPSNMTVKAMTDSYVGEIYAVVQDSEYVYCGGSDPSTVCQYWKTNMTLKTNTSTYGGHVYGLSVQENPVVKLQWYSNLTGPWLIYGTSYVSENQTVCILNSDMTNASTSYWWKVNAESNETVLDNQTFTFTTGNNYSLNLFENILNATGTHEYLLNESGYQIWANYSGNNSILILESLINATGTNISVWNGSTWFIWNNYTGDTTSINLTESIIDATGSLEYFMNDTGYEVFANYTGNVTICNSTNLTILENLIGTNGTNQTAYNNLTGWLIWNNYTGDSTNLTVLENLVTATGTNETAYTVADGWTVWNNYTGNRSGIVLGENIVNAVGTHEYFWSPLTGVNGEWWVYANYTGTGGERNLTVINPNPANNSNNTVGYLYGVNTSVNITYFPNLVGKYLNLTMSSNSSGTWTDYYREQISSNGTYYTFNMNFSWPESYFYWNTSVSTDDGYYVNNSYWFKTAPSLNFSITEILTNCTGSWGGSWTPEFGLNIWNNYTGYSLNLTVLENLVSATGTNETNYTSDFGWVVWSNYTGTATGDEPLLVINPNPGNNSNNTISYSYGVNTSVTIIYFPSIVGDFLNLSMTSNSSGTWSEYYRQQIGRSISWTNAGDADWLGRNSFGSVVYHGKIWVFGGIQADTNDDVWYSTDGVSWTQATVNAGFGYRLGYASLVYDDKMWVMGGYTGDDVNDVWYSTDGILWTEATAHAGWSERRYPTSVVFDNKMWVIGGSSGSKEVWYSTNGVDWTEATADAGWSIRSSSTAVVYDGKIWMMGGGVYNDVWYSINGADWTNLGNASWSIRTGAVSAVYDNKMWVMGGYNDISGNFLNDVWYSTDGGNWTNVGNASWTKRVTSRSVVFDDKLWVLGGGTIFSNMNDTWYYDSNACTTRICYTYNMNFSQPNTIYYWNTSVWNDTGYYINNTWWFKTGPSSNFTITENLANVTGTYQYAYSDGNGLYVWNNYTGYSILFNIINNTVNATGTNESNYSTITGWTIWNNFTGNTTDINLHENILNAIGTHEYFLNATGYEVWANYTGNATVCNSTNLTILEHLVQTNGTNISAYNPITGWTVWNNYTGDNTNITILESLFNTTGTNVSSYNATTGWTIWNNYTGFSIDLSVIEHLISASGSHESNYSSITGWIVWANYTGNGSELLIYDIMPSNGSLVLRNNTGINTLFSITYNNYTIGDTLNVTFWSNSSGTWLPYGNATITANGTYYAFNQNFTNSSETYYWNISIDNGTYWWNQTNWFEMSTPGYEMSWLPFTILGFIPWIVKRRKKKL